MLFTQLDLVLEGINMYSYSLLIKPLGFSSFRWYGEFNPKAKGPIAIGITEPLPLPSTIIGALGNHFGCTFECAYIDPLENIKKCINHNMGKDVVIKGPLLVEDRISNTFYLHLWPGKLLKLKVSSSKVYIEISDAPIIELIGTALRHDRKNVTPHLLYVQRLIDMTKYNVLVEIYNTNRKLSSSVLRFGGEFRSAFMDIIYENPMYKYLEDLWRNYRSAEMLLLVASPIILDTSPSYEDLVKNPDKSVLNILRRLIEKIQGISIKNLTYASGIYGGLKLSLIGLGYDIACNMLRPLFPAIMPGSIISITTDASWHELYLKGLGLYTKYGWGTVIPLPKEKVEMK